MLEILTAVILEKSAEIVLGLLLEKFCKWILSETNTKHASKLIKTKIIRLYFHWLFLQSSFKALPEEQFIKKSK